MTAPVELPETENCWWAEMDKDGPFAGMWVPTLQAAGGCFSLPIAFEDREGCDDFIREEILEASHDGGW